MLHLKLPLFNTNELASISIPLFFKAAALLFTDVNPVGVGTFIGKITPFVLFE